MFFETIKNSFRKVFIKISKKYNIDSEIILKDYLNEYKTSNTLSIFKYQDFELLKDCYNNLYYPDKDDNLDLIGYINSDNEIIFDKLMQNTIKKSKKTKKTKPSSNIDIKEEINAVAIMEMNIDQTKREIKK